MDTVADVALEPPPPAAPPAPPPVLPPPLPDPIPALAVTVASTEVLNDVTATPAASVMTEVAASVPAVVVKMTGIEPRGLPLMSVTAAVSVVLPPRDDTVAGLAPKTTLPTAAAPTAILRERSPVLVPPAPPVPPLELEPFDVVAPPEIALMIAVPLADPALKVTVARPLTSVLASTGSIVPNVVVKLTLVPLWGGVPEDSSTCATIVAVPLIGKAVVAEVNVMVDPVGARSGTFSQPITPSATIGIRTTARRDIAARNGRNVRDIIGTLTS